ncbi:MAG TPA: AAA family ATPase [Chitinophagaceae bacterium]|jgi:ATP/maltotriose-dependent transcriptional regulator MalT|nr:AAA family ATPase [Chitinophagaceae bacterium]
MQTELIERADFLDTLQVKFGSVVEGEGQCVLLSGEAGIGKTSLIKAFCQDKKKDCKIYRGTCDALFTPRPLAPIYDIVWQIRGDNNLDTTNRSVLFSQLFREIEVQKGTILIVIEDIHWADEATLDFIKFFARRINRLHCLFILTYRDNEIFDNHPFRNVVGQLPPDSFSRMQLSPLSRQAVEKMSEERGYKGEDVFSISGGNPFYVTEILASYSPGVPDNIKDSILSVYHRQAEGTKNAWEICSVIPGGLEINRFGKIKSSWDAEMDHCFALQIIVIKNNRVIFKHELYRRTIEASLSPFKRIALNKKILDLFLDSFEEEGEIERIVHYAKNANENKLVVKYAPIAARQAACVGAHIEASKLYLTAIEYSDGDDIDQMVEFYESYAYECYLTNQVKDAIIYQGKALKIRQQKNEIEQAGNSLRLLSRLWWFDGNRQEAEKYGKQAIEILESQPTSKAKAMAYSNMSQLKLLSDETSECIEWGNKAIEMAKELKDDEIRCHAMNNVGSILWKTQSSKDKGKEMLFESLDIALENSFHEHAARAYSNIVSNYLLSKEYKLARQVLEDGINYCEERNLHASKNYKLFVKAKIFFETGNWQQASSILENLLSNPSQLGSVKMAALTVLAIIKIRKGEEDALVYLNEAKRLAIKTKEHIRVISVMIAELEYEWLTGKELITEDELSLAFELIKKVENDILNSEFAFWLQKTRKKDIALSKLYEPYKHLKEGKIRLAAGFWETVGCPFEKAFALFAGNEDDKKNALLTFQQIGADAVSEKIKMEMRAGGIKKIPRGLRESTKTNPAQLTNRELDVLNLLQKGIQNKEIAGTLFISPKTADHHISNILFKLDVNSRSKAVAEAVRLGILK